MRRALVGGLTGLLLLAGCSATDPEADPAGTHEGQTGAGSEDQPAPTGSDRPKDTPVDIGVDPGVAGGLADLAEELAGERPELGSTTPRTAPVLGADVSWPQCPEGMGIPERESLGLPMPGPESEYVVVGLTNGPGFTVNPCLADQVRWVRDRSLMISAYSVVSFPTNQQLRRYGADGPHAGDDRQARLANVGHAQATYNLANMEAAGLVTPIIWIDVETVRGYPWSDDRAENAALVRGMAKGYRDAGYAVGVYSSNNEWRQIMGSHDLGGVPEWRTAGPTTRANAERRCAESPGLQGGTPVMGQWWDDERDYNITCRGVEQELERWFHRY